MAGGFGYGYDGQGSTGGLIKYTLNYTPPPIAGDYKATIRVGTDPTQVITPAVTTYSVLQPLQVTVLATLYPIGSTEALAGDLVILQLDVSVKTGDVAIDTVASTSKATAAGDLVGTSPLSFVVAAKVHPSLRQKWDVDPRADFLLPLTIPLVGTVPGRYNPTITIEDIAGQIVSTTIVTSPIVDVVNTRKSISVYLMPQFSFVSPPLQCSAGTGDCTTDFKFKIKELLEKQTVPRSKLDPAFLPNVSAPGDVPLSELVGKVFWYERTASTADFVRFNTDSGFFSDLLSMGVGDGYIIKTKKINNIDPFLRITDSTNVQFETTGIAVPLKLTFTGDVLADPDNQIQLPPQTTVRPNWNLVGPHTEANTNVGTYLVPVTLVQRTWVQLLAFRNLLDISLDDEGKVKLRTEGKPEIVFKTRFETLRPPPNFPDSGSPALPSGSRILADEGLWLFMCEQPTATCVGGTLSFLPVPAQE